MARHQPVQDIKALIAAIWRDEHGSTIENVIWIAGLAALALAVLAFLGPEIMAAVGRIRVAP